MSANPQNIEKEIVKEAPVVEAWIKSSNLSPNAKHWLIIVLGIVVAGATYFSGYPTITIGEILAFAGIELSQIASDME